MDRIKTAVIGVGSLGQHHARILAKHPKSELIAVVDSDIKRAEKIASIYKISFFNDVNKIKNVIKAAVVSVPTQYHYEIAKDLLESGINCLVEKPFTSNIREAQNLIEISKKKDLVLQVGHVERFNPAIVSAQSYISEPKIIEVNRLGPYDSRTSHIGVVFDLMIHDLDILLTFVKGKINSLEAYGAKILSDNEDIAKVRIKFQNGCVADLSASRVSLEKYRKIRIFQPNSYISVDYAGKSLKIYKKKYDIVKSFSDIEIITPKLINEEPLYLELDHFISCIEQGKKPIVSGEHGRDAMELASDILRNMIF